MKVKRRLLAFFFSVLMIWQGFFFAKAEGEDSGMVSTTEEAPNKPITFSKELVNGGIQEVKDEDGEGEYHYLLEYVVRFNAKNLQGQHDENGYDNLIFQDSLESDMLRFFNPITISLNSTFENEEKYIPTIKKGVWKSGEYQDNNGERVFVPDPDDTENPGSSFALFEDEEGTRPAVKAHLDYENLEYLHEHWSNNERRMQYRLGHIGANEGFEIRYFVEIIEFPEKGSKYKNKAEILNLPVKAQEHTYTVKEDADSFEGQEYSFTIEKTDKQDGSPLEGAEFLVSSLNTGYKKLVETGKDGKVTVHNLIKEYYDIEEINPPKGYKMNEEGEEREKSIVKDQFDETSEVVVHFQNEKKLKKEDSDKRDIIVEKVWHVKPGTPEPAYLPVEDFEEVDFDDEENKFNRNESFFADGISNNRNLPYSPSVTVYLLRDGKVIREAEIDPQIGFGSREYIFKDLPRKDEDGKEIIYTVKEKPLANYTTTITGSQDTKFTIMNNYSEGDQSMIPVTKIWRGEGPHPRKVEVILFENKKAVKSAWLNDGNDWQYHFERNKTDEYNQPIDFEVREVPVEGYEMAVENDADTGYLNVFINTKKQRQSDSDKGDETSETHENGGSYPNPSGGGSSPRGIGNPPVNESRDIPIPSETTAEVLGLNRFTSDTEKESEQHILGAERVPKVLGRGRGLTETSDSSAMRLYLALFLISAIGFSFTLLYEKRKPGKKR